MKQKNIKKILRQEIDKHIPEQLDTSSFGLIKSEKPIKNKRFYFSRNFGLSLASFVLVGILIAAFALKPGGDIINRQPYAFKGENQVVSFSAMSTSSLLSHLDNNELISSNQIVLLGSLTSENPINPIIPYLEMAERFIKINDGFSITEGESELIEYEHKTVFTTTTLTDTAVTYKMYYNIVDQSIEDDEESYQMEGILIYGQKTYKVQGLKKIEDDEQVIEFKSLIDENNYVESRYEIETDETKFSFKVVANGKTVEESIIEIEEEDDETEITLEFINGLDKRVYEFSYEQKDGKSILSINYETLINGVKTEGEIEVYVLIDPITNETKYKLILDDDDDEYEVDRDDEDEDDEEDEEQEDEEQEDDEEDEEDDEEEF